ncbi:MAG: polyisoprenoid-binding protein [Flavobacteriales bacterium]|nr:polyisoprenoid-binding protein [Flavobacteriales bacterium]|tara:strand:- start:9602 stop:10129 length:528 start_codon:yes stop_codon:yes gene_type:complete
MRFLILTLIPFISFAQNFFVDDSKISFFSWAPLENISAVSDKLEGVVNFETGDFFFRIPINTFIFPSSLMQKHFNEKYMESDVYEFSTFKGKFSENIFLSDDTTQFILSNGILSIHGQEKNVSIKTELVTQDSLVNFSSNFNVFLKDYKIKVPKIVRMNIADTIAVNVSGSLIKK